MPVGHETGMQQTTRGARSGIAGGAAQSQPAVETRCDIGGAALYGPRLRLSLSRAVRPVRHTAERGGVDGARAAIVAPARSGSSWLVSILDAHPQIRFHGEVFNLEHAPRAAVCDPAAYLRARLAPTGPQRIVGCKVLYHQAQPAYVRDFLAEMAEGRPAAVDWRAVFADELLTGDGPALAGAWEALRDGGATRIIHLRRRNLLRQHISHARLMATSRSAWRREGCVPAPRPIVVAIEPMLGSFAEATRRSAEIARFFAANPTIEVWYEDLCTETLAQIERMLAFLCVARWPLPAAPPAAAPVALRLAIANYDAVAAALADTPWASFLDDAGADSRDGAPRGACSTSAARSHTTAARNGRAGRRAGQRTGGVDA
jgi:LPS sulfotransferase NodH